jgi:hypothetical protein
LRGARFSQSGVGWWPSSPRIGTEREDAVSPSRRFQGLGGAEKGRGILPRTGNANESAFPTTLRSSAMLYDVNHETKLKKEGYGQYNTATCWLSCYRMLFKWKGQVETGIRGKLESAGLDYAAMCRRGVYREELPTAGSALAMCGWDGKLVQVWSDEQVLYVLDGYGPLFFTWDHGQSGHALLVVGFDAGSKLFKIYNPYGTYPVGEVEVEWMTGQQFRAKLLRARWALQAWY